MRITFFKNIKTMSGKCSIGNMVFGAFKNASICIARNYVYPTLTEQNEIQAEKMRAGVTVWKTLSTEFIKDLVEYAHLYNFQKHDPNKLNLTAYNLYMKVVLGLAATISDKEDLGSVVGNTVAMWIENKFLPVVVSSKTFENVI